MSLNAAPIRGTAPAAAPRPCEENSRGRRKSETRMAVEKLLLECKSTINPAQVAAHCGISLDDARHQLSNICREGLGHNTKPGTRGGAAYKAGPDPRPKDKATVIAIESRIPEGSYDARELRPFQGRRGAMAAFNLPSLIDGERVPRRPPMIIGRQPDPKR